MKSQGETRAQAPSVTYLQAGQTATFLLSFPVGGDFNDHKNKVIF